MNSRTGTFAAMVRLSRISTVTLPCSGRLKAASPYNPGNSPVTKRRVRSRFLVAGQRRKMYQAFRAKWSERCRFFCHLMSRSCNSMYGIGLLAYRRASRRYLPLEPSLP